MKTNHLLISIFILLVISISCVGPKGENGMDGRDGKDANVGAAIYDISPNKWIGNVDGFKTTLNVPEITENVYYNGLVLVYMLKNENSADKSFNQLPYTWLNNSNTEYMDFDAFIGRIEITVRWDDNGINNTEAPTENYSFKVIVATGVELSVLERETDLNNPDAVLNYLSGKTTF